MPNPVFGAVNTTTDMTLASLDGARALLLLVSGLGLSVYALTTWNKAGFGQLDYPETLRIVIPGATLIACGMQTVLSALFLSVLGLVGIAAGSVVIAYLRVRGYA